MQEKYWASWIIIDENKRVLLIKRWINKNYCPNYFAFPWWMNEKDEIPENTAIREVREEIWLEFVPERLFLKDLNNDFPLYRFLWKYSWKIVLQEEECDGYGWYTYEETQNLLLIDNVKFVLQKLHDESLI